jgi:hypothetical protein
MVGKPYLKDKVRFTRHSGTIADAAGLAQISGFVEYGRSERRHLNGEALGSSPHRPRTSLASLCYTPLRTASPFLIPNFS